MIRNEFFFQLIQNEDIKNKLPEIFKTDLIDDLNKLYNQIEKTNLLFTTNIIIKNESLFFSFFVPLKFYEDYREVYNSHTIDILQLKENYLNLSKKFEDMEKNVIYNNSNEFQKKL